MIDKNSPQRLDEGHIVPLPPLQKADQDLSPPTLQKPAKEEAVLFHHHHQLQSNEKGNYCIKIGYLMT